MAEPEGSMMTFVDLGPAADRMAGLVRRVPDAALDAPTPCREYSVGDLVDHIAGLTLAFTAAATKTADPARGEPSPGDAARLGSDWRTRIPPTLDALADAWRDPAARSGMTRAGGIDLPGEVAAVVALEELVVHGWDLARATGQPFECDDAEVRAVSAFFSQFVGADADLRGSAYRGPVDVDDTASPLDRVVALSGRDPGWSP
jgi:uncharacterized protein (TIGR03086 family)